MEIQINREKRLLLLKWLKQGYIDALELSQLQKDNQMTADEIESELDRLAKWTYNEDCQRLQRLGLCKLKER